MLMMIRSWPTDSCDAMRTNFVLIDYENVQPTSLIGLDEEHFRVIVFIGANQNKLAFDTAAAIQNLGARAAWRSRGI
jgi:hypothetical protein